MKPCTSKIEVSTTTKAMMLDNDNKAVIAPDVQKNKAPAVHEEAPLKLADEQQQEMDKEEKEDKPNSKKAPKAIGGKDSKKKKLTDAELKQRNAIYSKRKYDRKKIEFEVQQEQCKRLRDQNQAIKAEYDRLQELHAKAQKCIQVFHQQQQQQQQATSACPQDGENRSTSITPLVHHGTLAPVQQELRQQLLCEQLLQWYYQEQQVRASRFTVEAAQAVVRQCDHGQQQHEEQQQQLLAEIASLLRQKAAAAYHQDLHYQQLLAPLLKRGGAAEAEHAAGQCQAQSIHMAGDLKVVQEDQKQQQQQPSQSNADLLSAGGTRAIPVQDQQGQQQQEKHHEILASLMPPQQAWNKMDFLWGPFCSSQCFLPQP